MSKLVTCKTCGAQIAKSAKACPNCGARNRRGHPGLVGSIAILLVVAFTAIVVSALSDGSSNPVATPAPSASASPATASPSAKPEEQILVENGDVSVTFEKLYEETGIQGAAYLKLAMTNKTDREIWVYLDKGSVNDEQMASFLSGMPTYIMPGKTSRNPFIISYSQLSIESVNEIKSIEFDVVVADRESLDEISRISGVQIQP